MSFAAKAGWIAASLTVASVAAQAKPEYAKKENKACGYCHVKEEGGGPRNMRGIYYAMHNHTFEGFADAAGGAPAVKKTGTPAFKMSWSVAAPEGSKRVGIGAIASDGTLAVVTLSGNKLTVSKVGAAGLTADGTTDDLKDAGKFVVGTFSKGKPASIIVPGKIIYRKDGKLTVRDTTDITNITGYVKFTDGTENVFYYEGAAPEVFAIDPTADKPVTGGKEMVPPDQGGGVYADLTIHPPVELLGALGIPEEAQKSGVMGIFDPRGESKVYPWLIWAGKDGKTVIAVAEGNIGGGAELKPIWTSQPVEGKVLDAAFGKDPKNPKVSGMLLLTASGADGKDRKLVFFALD